MLELVEVCIALLPPPPDAKPRPAQVQPSPVDQKAPQFYYDQGLFEFGADTSLTANAQERLTKTERVRTEYA